MSFESRIESITCWPAGMFAVQVMWLTVWSPRSALRPRQWIRARANGEVDLHDLIARVGSGDDGDVVGLCAGAVPRELDGLAL